jgi:hypothetical protein
VAKKVSTRKTETLGFRLTPEQKDAIETLAIQMGWDVVELIQIASIAIYDMLGQGKSDRWAALARDPSMWKEISGHARERAEREREAIRVRK